MGKRSGMDQTGAWLLAVFLTLCLFGLSYAILKNLGSQRQEFQQIDQLNQYEDQVLKEIDDHPESEDSQITTDSEAEQVQKNQKKPPSWSYKGRTGPEFWGDLSSQYAECQLGKKQSPIDLKKSIPDAELRNHKFFYKSEPVSLTKTPHTIEAKFHPGSYFLSDGMRYNLVSMSFHLPSEHTVDGIPYDMELQLVHQNADGNYANIAIFMEESSRSNKILNRLWPLFPKESNVSVQSKEFNPLDLIPNDKTYDFYTGSLTHPPCFENVDWYVYKEPIKISANQIDQFISHHRNNSRPVQAKNGRKIRHNDN